MRTFPEYVFGILLTIGSAAVLFFLKRYTRWGYAIAQILPITAVGLFAMLNKKPVTATNTPYFIALWMMASLLVLMVPIKPKRTDSMDSVDKADVPPGE